MKLQPLGVRVIVKPIEEEQTTASGLVLPDTASKEKPEEGEVIAVGNGELLDDGTRRPLDVSVGDKVLFSKYGGNEVTVDDEDLLVLKEVDILAKISS